MTMYKEVVRNFAYRTRRNLEEVERLHKEGHKVYEATQLINSMLGLLVFPQQEYVNSIPRKSLGELKRDGWPIPRVRGEFRQVSDLNQLIRYLRNAIAHFNIKFIGDGDNQIAMLQVWNMRPVRDKNNRVVRDEQGNIVEEKNWEAELSLNDLRLITNRFIDMLLEPEDTT